MFSAQGEASPTPFVRHELTLRFDDTNPTTNTNSRLLVQLAHGALVATYLRFQLGEGTELIALGSDGARPIVADVQAGVPYRIGVTADLTEDVYQVRVTDASSGAVLGNDDAVPFPNPVTSLDRLSILSTASAGDPPPHRVNVDLDDISVQELSAPATTIP